MNYSINAMYNNSEGGGGGHLHLSYRQCVYKCDSSVYLDGHLLFSLRETNLPINIPVHELDLFLNLLISK